MRKLIKLGCLIVAILLTMQSFAYAVVKYEDKDGNMVTLDNFLDTKGHWAEKEIAKWEDFNIIEGFQGYFKPNNKILRRDVAVIVDRLLGLTDISVHNFADLESNQYYTSSILKLVALQAIDYKESKVRPNSNATREEVVNIIAKAFKIEPSYYSQVYYTDGNKMNPEFEPYINAMSNLGYLRGKGNNLFDPKGQITRAELMKIIDNLVSGYYDMAGTYTDFYSGNSIINKNGVSFYGSNIDGGVYLAYGVTGTYSFDTVTMTGDVTVLGRNTSLDFQRSKIYNINLYGKTAITGADQVQYVKVSQFATESTISGNDINAIELDPHTSVTIKIAGDENAIKLVNDTDFVKYYTDDEMNTMILDKYGKVPNGPTIDGGEAIVSHTNQVIFKNFKVKKGASDIKKVYLVYNKSSNIPTFYDHDEKVLITDYLKDGIVNYTINKRVKSTEEWSYRIVVQDVNGLLAYSEPKFGKGYDYDVRLSIAGTGPVEEGMVVHITGDRIPQITRVAVTYNNGGSVYNEIQLQAQENQSSTNVDKSKTYTAKAMFKDGLKYKFGYKIYFTNGEEETNNDLREITYKAMADTGVYQLSTGTVSNIYNGHGTVYNNYVIKGTSEISETGVAYKIHNIGESVSINDNDWVYIANFQTGGVFSDNYSVDIPVGTSGSRMCSYMAYAKTNQGTAYGEIKTLVGGGAPIILDSTYQAISEDTVILTVNYSSLADIYLTRQGSISKFSKDGVVNSTYFNGTFATADGKANGNKLSLKFTGLVKGDYDIGLIMGNKNSISQEYITSIATTKCFDVKLNYISTDADGYKLYEVVRSNDKNIKIDEIRATLNDNYTQISTVKDINSIITHIKYKSTVNGSVWVRASYNDGMRTQVIDKIIIMK